MGAQFGGKNITYCLYIKLRKIQNPTMQHISKGMYEFNIQGITLVAHYHKVLFWEDENALFLSDPHFGKVNHFQKNGIFIPGKLLENNYQRLEEVIHQFNPNRIIILGDLFHSVQNQEWGLLKSFFEGYYEIEFHLILGNHDIIEKYELKQSRLIIHKQLETGPFILTHFPIENYKKSKYNLAGHVHPGVRLKGSPGQSVKLPCFYFTYYQGILPAFGDFTGLFRIKPKKKDQIIAIAGQELIYFSS